MSLHLPRYVPGPVEQQPPLVSRHPNDDSRPGESLLCRSLPQIPPGPDPDPRTVEHAKLPCQTAPGLTRSERTGSIGGQPWSFPLRAGSDAIARSGQVLVDLIGQFIDAAAHGLPVLG